MKAAKSLMLMLMTGFFMRIAEAPAFDDKNWRTLDLPHDWSFEDQVWKLMSDKMIG